jgi:hypothetical protein
MAASAEMAEDLLGATALTTRSESGDLLLTGACCYLAESPGVGEQRRRGEAPWLKASSSRCTVRSWEGSMRPSAAPPLSPLGDRLPGSSASFPHFHRGEVAYYALTTLYTYANYSGEPKLLEGIELRGFASVFHRSSVSVSSVGRQRFIGRPEGGGVSVSSGKLGSFPQSGGTIVRHRRPDSSPP